MENGKSSNGRLVREFPAAMVDPPFNPCASVLELSCFFSLGVTCDLHFDFKLNDPSMTIGVYVER